MRFRYPNDIGYLYRSFYCPHMKNCAMKYEKHSYLVNTCIGALNLPIYYFHVVVELVNNVIIFFSIILTIDERLDSDLLLFILYFFCSCGHTGLYFKKFLVHTKTMLTGESLHERVMGADCSYKNKKILNMMEKM